MKNCLIKHDSENIRSLMGYWSIKLENMINIKLEDMIRECSGLLVVSELVCRIRLLRLHFNNIPMSIVIEFLKLIANYTLNERFIASKKNRADKKYCYFSKLLAILWQSVWTN